MSMHTGENEQGLRKIIDLTRLLSILILLLHIYYYCYAGFKELALRSDISDKLLLNIVRTGMFSFYLKSKLICLALLLISLIGVKGRKNETAKLKSAVAYSVTGTVVYFISFLVLYLPYTAVGIGVIYSILNITGYLMILTGGSVLARMIKNGLKQDVFNRDN